ncbi:biotin/lipoyl-containing protein [uncultured Cetobacterium sp.]|uniref:acetyl-CoA carboxylase biotin carboxyl carrier protein n=1 Tax=uncultured Cetobacterium sp. TaxID=527638 RepID=UPI00262F4ED4|nr:biotin/lipoyl-containing protein [uncultured Cetobacterium sp.]
MKKEEFQVEDLINILSECGLTELEYQQDENIKIKIKKSPEPKKTFVKEKLEVSKVVQKKDELIKTIVSTGIGKYYYENLISIGDKIKVGQDLGYIFVMGLKTPLRATVGGEITEITVENGGIVDYGKILIKVKSTGR